MIDTIVLVRLERLDRTRREHLLYSLSLIQKKKRDLFESHTIELDTREARLDELFGAEVLSQVPDLPHPTAHQSKQGQDAEESHAGVG